MRSDLCFSLEIGPFSFKRFKSSEEAGMLQMFFDKLHELLIFGFEVGMSLLLFVLDGLRAISAFVNFFADVGGIGGRLYVLSVHGD
jgi:hypothetical protein